MAKIKESSNSDKVFARAAKEERQKLKRKLKREHKSERKRRKLQAQQQSLRATPSEDPIALQSRSVMATTEDFTLHQMPDSGNSYKIRLVASFLNTPIKLINYDVLKNETRTEAFTSRINANGRVPVLQIGADTFLPESSAACYYLATDSKLVPKDKLVHAQMLQWMFFEQYSHEPALAVLKYWRHQLGEANLSELQRAQIPGKERQAREVLGVMERHLESREWFAGESVTLADVSLYAYTHTAHWSGFDLGEWPNVKVWCERFTRVDGFVKLLD